MQKNKDYNKQEKPWDSFRSAGLELLGAERLILEFLHHNTMQDEQIRPTTKITLYEFRKYLEEKKDTLDEYFEDQL